MSKEEYIRESEFRKALSKVCGELKGIIRTCSTANSNLYNAIHVDHVVDESEHKEKAMAEVEKALEFFNSATESLVEAWEEMHL